MLAGSSRECSEDIEEDKFLARKLRMKKRINR
jgi:hypothetical protein